MIYASIKLIMLTSCCSGSSSASTSGSGTPARCAPRSSLLSLISLCSLARARCRAGWREHTVCGEAGGCWGRRRGAGGSRQRRRAQTACSARTPASAGRRRRHSSRARPAGAWGPCRGRSCWGRRHRAGIAGRGAAPQFQMLQQKARASGAAARARTPAAPAPPRPGWAAACPPAR